MDLSRIPLFAAMAKRMDWLTERQAVLAENVANADTPGYVARDLRQPDFGSLVGGAAPPLALVATRPGHITPKHRADRFATVETPGERTLTGNGVSLEEQMMKVSQTASDFALTTNLYRKHLGLIKTALGRLGG